MNPDGNGGTCRRQGGWSRFALGLVVAAAMAYAGTAAAAGPKTFTSPEQAADALAAAWHAGGRSGLLAIFGPAGEKLVVSGDPVAEKQARERLAAAYDEAHRVESEGEHKAVIILGKEEWPYPIPIVEEGSAWRFDARSGADHIIERRIGRNELNAIRVCRAYVEAQREYAARDPQHSGRHQYARRLASSKGRHDGLYWPAAEGEAESPFGPLAASAEAKGYGKATAEGRAPFHGYFYRILSRQGPDAPGGARDYLVKGSLAGGFALIAFPARYGDSGVMSFIVNQDGIVFEKNLGPHTAGIAGRIAAYDPDAGWKAVRE